MPDEAGAVIIGAGQAGAEFAFALRTKGYAFPITLVGDEPHLPYRRPPLSKEFLAREATPESLYLKPAAAYEKATIACVLGVSASGIDRAARTVSLSDGRVLRYRHLALAVGGRVRRLDIPGAEKPNVLYLRNIADVEKIHGYFECGKRLVIIGGGYVGLEVAAVARAHGLDVTLLEYAPRLLARVAAPELSAFYEDEHRRQGVDVRTNARLEAFHGQALVEAVELQDGERVACDAVIVGIGLVPSTELARAAGLEVDNGIAVDIHGRTSDPDVFALGDCAFLEHGFYGARMRLESVPNAVEQAKAAAATICGAPTEYKAVPWFWSDQYDLKLQMVGLSNGYDRLVLRGDPGSRAFSAFYLKDNVVISADAVNRPGDFMAAKRMVAERRKVLPELLADERVSMKELLAGGPGA